MCGATGAASCLPSTDGPSTTSRPPRQCVVAQLLPLAARITSAALSSHANRPIGGSPNYPPAGNLLSIGRQEENNNKQTRPRHSCSLARGNDTIADCVSGETCWKKLNTMPGSRSSGSRIQVSETAPPQTRPAGHALQPARVRKQTDTGA